MTALDAPAVEGPTTDPTQLLRLAESMHAIEVVAAAVGWLDLFEWLAVNPSPPTTIAAHFELAERPVMVMLTLFRALGLVEVDGSGDYGLSRLAREYLLSSSPWTVAPVFTALKDRPSCQQMLEVLRTGRPTGFGAEGAEDWMSGMDDETFAEFFLGAIDSRNAYLAHAVASELVLEPEARLLDIGGGSGIYACALAARNPRLRATVFEKAPVDEIARRAISRRGLSDRVDVLAGDMLADALPGGYDVHLYSNVVHDWDETRILTLLRASFASLDPGGRVVVHDAMLDPDGAGPQAVAEYSVLLMAFTAGRCYSQSELAALLHAAGFAEITHQATVVQRDLLVAAKPS